MNCGRALNKTVTFQSTGFQLVGHHPSIGRKRRRILRKFLSRFTFGSFGLRSVLISLCEVKPAGMTTRKVNKDVKRESSREDEPMVRVQRQREMVEAMKHVQAETM